MEKMSKNFYLKRIEYLEKELKNKDDRIDQLEQYINHLEDIYDDIVKLIDNTIGDEFYINLDKGQQLLYRIREYIKGSDSND